MWWGGRKGGGGGWSISSATISAVTRCACVFRGEGGGGLRAPCSEYVRMLAPVPCWPRPMCSHGLVHRHTCTLAHVHTRAHARRLLKPQEDEVTQHYAVKTIENICSQGGDWAASFCSNDVAFSLVQARARAPPLVLS